jgi:hypothetical protein
MATTSQIEANRRNSLKSTGPRTPEGQAVSRLNALACDFAQWRMVTRLWA